MGEPDPGVSEFVDDLRNLTTEQLDAVWELRRLADIAAAIRVGRDHTILRSKRLGLSSERIAREVKVSRATVYRAIENIREFDGMLKASTRYKTDRKGRRIVTCMLCEETHGVVGADAWWVYLHLKHEHGWVPGKTGQTPTN